MSYDSQLEGMLALAIAMGSGNASEGLKTVQSAEQSRVRNSSRLPRDMRPSQAAFEALGFTFTDIGDDVLFEAILPECWSTQETPGSSILWENLVDDKGRVRGNYCYKGVFYDRYGHMSLSGRYHLTYQHTDPDNYDSPINVVVTVQMVPLSLMLVSAKKLIQRNMISSLQKLKSILSLTILNGKMLRNIGIN